MRQKLSLLTTLFVFVTISYCQEYKNLYFSPAKPKPGDVIKIEYSTLGTVLGDVRDFDAVAYIDDGQLRAQEISLTTNGNKWNGEIQTNDSTKVIFVVFKKDKLIDNNKEQGYSLMLYKNSEPVAGAYAAKAEANSGLGTFLMQLKIDPRKNLELFNKEFQRDPGSKSRYLGSYAHLLVQIDNATAKSKMQPLINGVKGKKNITESDYQNIMWAYQRLGDKENVEKFKKEIIKKYPDGAQAKSDALNALYNEPDLGKQEELLNSYITKYPPKTDADKKTLDNIYNYLASSAAAKKNWDVFKKFEGMVNDKGNLAGTYNNIAWNLTGQSIDAEAGDLVMAKELSGKSLQYLKASMESAGDKPTFYTAKEYKKNLQFTYGMYGDTYALILWKTGSQEEAYKVQEEAIANMNKGDAEANERYIVYKEKLQGAIAVKDDIVQYLKDGKSSPKLNELLKKAFVAEGHNENEFDAYLEGLKVEYRAKLREELIKNMINDPAPKFALKDLSGKSVSLDELKGKVVVVDFWATWCGPCKASFPGMQIALSRYKNDPGVKFVFVDTWESKKPNEMKKNAGEFVEKNKYDFHVVLDTDDKVIGSYAVDGIPTKFVIDPESRIRFKAVGYDGSIDKLVDEISIMVDVLKPGDNTKKAF